MKKTTLLLLSIIICCSSTAEATLFSDPHIDITREYGELTVANQDYAWYGGDYPFIEHESGYKPRLSVPKFDTTKGELISAKLQILGRLDSYIGHHAYAPTGYVDSRLDARVTQELIPDSTISKLLGDAGGDADSVSMGNRIVSYDSDFAIVGPEIQQRYTLFDTYLFEETYSGPDLELFTQDFSTPGVEFLSLLGLGNYDTNAFIHHEGFPPTTWLEFPTEPSPGSKPGQGTAFLTLIRLLNDGHNVAYSDSHVVYESYMHLKIDYTYDTYSTQPVPEPTTMLLFGTGLVGLAGVSRRKKK